MSKKLFILNLTVSFLLFGVAGSSLPSTLIAQKGELILSKKIKKSAASKEIIGKDGTPMVLVPAGEFYMGSDDNRKDEKPRRKVYLDGFYIDKYPVTNKKFRVGGMKPKEDYGPKFTGDSQPVGGVNWNQAGEYCANAGKRLPTEAEWEKAARGTDGREYPWGNKWDSKKLISGYNSKEKTHAVDRTYNTHQSPYGAVDMAGNILEWVADWYGEDYYPKALARNPKGPASGTYKVFRGGAYKLSFHGFFLTYARGRSEPLIYYKSAGFRCAKALVHE
jgi:formylglycine-generating enzyme required for sulfatase activity